MDEHRKCAVSLGNRLLVVANMTLPLRIVLITSTLLVLKKPTVERLHKMEGLHFC